MNRIESRTRVSSSEAADALGHPIAWRIANDYAAIQSSAIGSPVLLSEPKARLSRDIQAIARQLTGVATPPRNGWLPWRRRTALQTV
jgi:Flp pilus assembly CpaE family ATPase